MASGDSLSLDDYDSLICLQFGPRLGSRVLWTAWPAWALPPEVILVGSSLELPDWGVWVQTVGDGGLGISVFFRLADGGRGLCKTPRVFVTKGEASRV